VLSLPLVSLTVSPCTARTSSFESALQAETFALLFGSGEIPEVVAEVDVGVTAAGIEAQPEVNKNMKVRTMIKRRNIYSNPLDLCSS
jgi:hypothetical protein